MSSILFLLLGIAAMLSAILTANLSTAIITSPSVTPTPDPIITAFATNTTYIDFTTGVVFVSYPLLGLSEPSNFQTAPDTFTIPKTGNYRIASSISVTEFSGIGTNVLYGLQVNTVKQYIFGLDSVRDNGGITMGGDIILSLVAGDIVKFAITQYFGTSTEIGYRGMAETPPDVFYLTYMSIQYMP